VLLDFLFMTACAVMIFLTSVSIIQDTLRGYMLAMFVIGAIVWEKTFGKLIRQALSAFIRLGKKTFHKAKSYICKDMHTHTRQRNSRCRENFCKKNEKERKSTSIFRANRLK
jgi:hypothetical protein